MPRDVLLKPLNYILSLVYVYQSLFRCLPTLVLVLALRNGIYWPRKIIYTLFEELQKTLLPFRTAWQALPNRGLEPLVDTHIIMLKGCLKTFGKLFTSFLNSYLTKVRNPGGHGGTKGPTSL